MRHFQLRNQIVVLYCICDYKWGPAVTTATVPVHNHKQERDPDSVGYSSPI